MDFILKNIILYDTLQNVSGFAELKIRLNQTKIKVRHNLENKQTSESDEELLLSIVADGEKSYVFALTGAQTLLELKTRLDIEREIFICIIKRNKGELQTLASGIINPDRKNTDKRSTQFNQYIAEPEVEQEIATRREFESSKDYTAENEIKPQKPLEIKEIDEAIRKVCVMDSVDTCQCKNCPYREHFYQLISVE